MAQDQQPGPSESGFTAYSRVIGAFQAQVRFIPLFYLFIRLNTPVPFSLVFCSTATVESNTIGRMTYHSSRKGSTIVVIVNTYLILSLPRSISFSVL